MNKHLVCIKLFLFLLAWVMSGCLGGDGEEPGAGGESKGQEPSSDQTVSSGSPASGVALTSENRTDPFDRAPNDPVLTQPIGKIIGELDASIQRHPQDAVAYADRGLAYIHLQEFEKAIKDLDEAIRLDPQSAVPYYYRGLVYRDVGQFQRALGDFNQAIYIDPYYTLAYTSRALVYTMMNKHTLAQADVDRAVELGYDIVILRMALEMVRTQSEVDSSR